MVSYKKKLSIVLAAIVVSAAVVAADDDDAENRNGLCDNEFCACYVKGSDSNCPRWMRRGLSPFDEFDSKEINPITEDGSGIEWCYGATEKFFEGQSQFDIFTGCSRTTRSTGYDTNCYIDSWIVKDGAKIVVNYTVDNIAPLCPDTQPPTEPPTPTDAPTKAPVEAPTSGGARPSASLRYFGGGAAAGIVAILGSML